jgi:hypothetical protein
MQGKLIVLSVTALGFVSCGQQSTHRISYTTNPGTDSSISIEISPDSATKLASSLPDTLTLRMDSTGKIRWLDNNRIRINDLQRQVQDTLISIYLRTARLPSRLDIQYLGTVTMGIRGTADDMIRQAQKVVINVIAVKTLNQSYGKMDSSQQKKFQKEYPVLFQTYY